MYLTEVQEGWLRDLWVHNDGREFVATVTPWLLEKQCLARENMYIFVFEDICVRWYEWGLVYRRQGRQGDSIKYKCAWRGTLREGHVSSSWRVSWDFYRRGFFSRCVQWDMIGSVMGYLSKPKCSYLNWLNNRIKSKCSYFNAKMHQTASNKTNKNRTKTKAN